MQLEQMTPQLHTKNMKIRPRRIVAVILSLIGLGFTIFLAAPPVIKNTQQGAPAAPTIIQTGSAAKALEHLVMKGRAPKTGYVRSQFGGGWSSTSGCDTRNIILHRDLQNPVLDNACNVIGGTLNDPYTGTVIQFEKGSSVVQVDHVVAISNAWQTGAQQLTKKERIQFANDPLELLAVQGDANQQKSDGDAATWLPPNKPFRCQYAARQIAIKQKYILWVTPAEKQALLDVLVNCPDQALPAK